MQQQPRPPIEHSLSQLSLNQQQQSRSPPLPPTPAHEPSPQPLLQQPRTSKRPARAYHNDNSQPQGQQAQQGLPLAMGGGGYGAGGVGPGGVQPPAHPTYQNQSAPIPTQDEFNNHNQQHQQQQQQQQPNYYQQHAQSLQHQQQQHPQGGGGGGGHDAPHPNNSRPHPISHPSQQPEYQQQSQSYQQHHHPSEQSRQVHHQQQSSFSSPLMAQPPHSSGARIPPKMRVKIDPDHIPSPVAVAQVDQDLYLRDPFLTCSRNAAPLSMTDFVAIDQGNANPRFIRATTYNIPTTDDLALASQLPLGLVIQPFANTRKEEGEVEVVDFTGGEKGGPPRCSRCRGYINPWVGWVEGGVKWSCNLCGATTEVPQEYFSHLDSSQRRLDLAERPELRLGSIDFKVSTEYYVQDLPPSPHSPHLAGSSLPPEATTSPLHLPPSLQPTLNPDGSTTPIPPSASSTNLTANPNAPSPRTPQPMNYIFLIDVSYTSARSGLVEEVVRGLRRILYPGLREGEEEESEERRKRGLKDGSRVAIVGFDRGVWFFNLKPTLDQAQMLVVTDLNDMFLPLSEGFLVDPWESRAVIEGLLDTLPVLAHENQNVEAALGGPMKAALLALKATGGQINLFQTCLPTLGPGTLKHREDTKLYGTDREKTLFVPQDGFYKTLAEECVDAGVGVNLFLFPNQYVDVATLGVLPGLTGGELFFHPRFEPVRDGAKLRAEIKRVVRRETGYSVTMRIRCSNGLRVADHFGNFFQRNVTDLEFGTLDADKAIAAKIKHEGKLDEKNDAHFQCAVLYTSASGERRVRVHNLAVPVTSLLASVFRFADMDTTLAYIAKDCVTQASSKSLRQVREQLTELCVKSLLAYRKHCASSTSPAQLILPESFKLFPLYALALMKSKALKGGPVASDVRTWSMRLIKSAGVAATVNLLYPRMLPLHTLPDEVGFPDETGRLRLPQLIRDSYIRMEPSGAYLIENGEIAIIWLGSAVSPQVLLDLYGVENLAELDVRMGSLPVLPTRLSTQVRNVLTYFETQRGGRSLPVLIARQNMDGTEIEFSNMLVEDQNNEGLSYPDYLCAVHAKIQAYLTDQKESASATDYSSYSSFMQ